VAALVALVAAAEPLAALRPVAVAQAAGPESRRATPASSGSDTSRWTSFTGCLAAGRIRNHHC